MRPVGWAHGFRGGFLGDDMTDQTETQIDRLSCIMADLYASEINFQISAFFDAGFTVWLGDDMNGFVAKTQMDTYEEAVLWLRDISIKKYPSSDFAGTYGARP